MNPHSNPSIAQNLAEARKFLDQGETTFFSPPYGALNLGVGYWWALCQELKEAFPGHDFQAVLDCSGAPAYALSAIEEGIQDLTFGGFSDDIAHQVNHLASEKGVRVHPLPYRNV